MSRPYKKIFENYLSSRETLNTMSDSSNLPEADMNRILSYTRPTVNAKTLRKTWHKYLHENGVDRNILFDVESNPLLFAADEVALWNKFILKVVPDYDIKTTLLKLSREFPNEFNAWDEYIRQNPNAIPIQQSPLLPEECNSDFDLCAIQKRGGHVFNYSRKKFFR
jgi:hypothetical protein